MCRHCLAVCAVAPRSTIILVLHRNQPPNRVKSRNGGCRAETRAGPFRCPPAAAITSPGEIQTETLSWAVGGDIASAAKNM